VQNARKTGAKEGHFSGASFRHPAPAHL